MEKFTQDMLDWLEHNGYIRKCSDGTYEYTDGGQKLELSQDKVLELYLASGGTQ